MADAAAFLRAVLDRPDDDGPRLVYADWLDERGDPKGEFIRVQCELAAAADEPRIGVLRRRAAELLESHGEAWTWPLAAVFEDYRRDDYARLWGPFGGLGQRSWDFYRGLVAAVKLPTADLLRSAAGLFALCPIQAVSLADFWEWPAARRAGGARVWFWEDGRWDRMARIAAGRFDVPAESCLGFAAAAARETAQKSYRTVAAARAATDRAAVAFGRTQAGLPPLPGLPDEGEAPPEGS